MPGMGGLELVAQVRRLPYRGRIIVFSSEIGEQVAAAYAALAVDQIMLKPMHPATLCHRVREVLQATA